MKVRPWFIGVASFGFLLALAGLYLVWSMWLAKAEIDTWEQVKYGSSPNPPRADLPIEIVGRQFEWRIRYPSSRRFQNDPQLIESFARENFANKGQADDIYLVNELRLWKGGKVQIHLSSADVPHSFFLPLLRLKQDATPGKVTDVWLEAMQSNVVWDADASDWRYGDEWEFACAEHSGQKMRGRLFVHETKDEFLRWLQQAEKVNRQRPRE